MVVGEGDGKVREKLQRVVREIWSVREIFYIFIMVVVISL